MQKKIYVFIGIVLIVLIAAIVTALRITTNGMQQGVVDMPRNVAHEGRSFAKSSLEMTDSTGVSDMAFTPSANAVDEGKKEVKSGSVIMRVNSVDRAVDDISAALREYDGVVHEKNIYKDAQDTKSGSVTVRVPSDRFDDALAAIKKVATAVINESVSGQDVTLAYRDLQARFKNKQAEEQAFLKILEQTTKVSDIIEVTRELSRVRGEIEQLQAQITYMDSQTDLATIMITLTEDATVTFSDQWRPMQVAKETVNSLLADMRGFVNFVIVLVIRVIPITILYGIIAFIVYKVVAKVIYLVRRKDVHADTQKNI